MDFKIITPPVSDAVATAWNACLDASAFASHYTGPEFFDEWYFKEKRPFAILAAEGSVIHGIATGYFQHNDVVVGSPGSPHICLRNDADAQVVGWALANGLRAHATRSTVFVSGYAWREMTGLRPLGFRRRVVGPPLCTILLDLSKGKDWLFRQCSETRRNKIRRAIKAGVEVSAMDVEREFDEYFDLYGHWCAEKQLPRIAYDLQRKVFASTANRLILVARHQGKMIGVSTFRFRRGGLVEYAANVSRREETRTRQNDLLLWRGIEWAVAQGCFTLFSMAGAHFFLQKYGGTMQPTYRYTLDLTLLHRRHAAENARLAALRVYRSLPAGLQRTAKKLLRGSPGEAE